MKKKILSLFLAFTLILSVCALIPVSAETPTPTALTENVAKIDDAATEITLKDLIANFATYASKKITLTKDIVAGATDDDITAWGSLPAFSGTLNGNGKSISGLTAPLFASVAGATINNLTVSGTIAADNSSALVIGLIAPTATGTVTMTNVATAGSITVEMKSSSYKVQMGGMFGTAASLTLEECTNDCALTQTGSQKKDINAGGFVGYYTGTIIAKRCVNTADLTFVQATTTLVGGFAGTMANTEDAKSVLDNCSNYGKISSYTSTSVGAKSGGFIGVSTGNSTNSLKNCYNSGSIEGAHVTGGMIGDANGKCNFENCINVGTITSKHQYAGGMIGQFQGTADASFVGCVNTGAITAKTVAAGFVPILTRVMSRFENNVNKGAITATTNGYASGLIGKVTKADAHTFKNSFSTGTVTGKNVGGLVAWSSAENVTLEVYNCYYTNADANIVGNFNFSKKVNNVNTDFVSEVTYKLAGAASNADAVKAASAKTAEQLAAILHTTAPKAQKSAVANGTYDVRILFGIDGLNYNNTGFQIMRVEDGSYCTNMITKETTTVYTSVNSYNETDGTVETYTAQGKFGTDYIAAIAINGVPAGKTVSFIVRPFVTEQDGSTVVYGNAYVFTYTVA